MMIKTINETKINTKGCNNKYLLVRDCFCLMKSTERFKAAVAYSGVNVVWKMVGGESVSSGLFKAASTCLILGIFT